MDSVNFDKNGNFTIISDENLPNPPLSESGSDDTSNLYDSEVNLEHDGTISSMNVFSNTDKSKLSNDVKVKSDVNSKMLVDTFISLQTTEQEEVKVPRQPKKPEITPARRPSRQVKENSEKTKENENMSELKDMMSNIEETITAGNEDTNEAPKAVKEEKSTEPAKETPKAAKEEKPAEPVKETPKAVKEEKSAEAPKAEKEEKPAEAPKADNSVNKMDLFAGENKSTSTTAEAPKTLPTDLKLISFNDFATESGLGSVEAVNQLVNTAYTKTIRLGKNTRKVSKESKIVYYTHTVLDEGIVAVSLCVGNHYTVAKCNLNNGTISDISSSARVDGYVVKFGNSIIGAENAYRNCSISL